MIFNIMFYTEKMPRNRPPQFQIGQACGTGRRPLGATKVMFSGTLDKVFDAGPQNHTKLIIFIGKPIDLAAVLGNAHTWNSQLWHFNALDNQTSITFV
jgi:hypothetical protein